PSPDQSELDYIGWRILQGEKLYVDVIDQNWPGAHWAHATFIAILGRTIYTWRIGDYLLMLAALACLSNLLRQAFGLRAAIIALPTYPILFFAGQWLTGQRDFVTAHLLLIAMCSHWRAWTTDVPFWQIATGFIIAAATLIKPTFL